MYLLLQEKKTATEIKTWTCFYDNKEDVAERLNY